MNIGWRTRMEGWMGEAGDAKNPNEGGVLSQFTAWSRRGLNPPRSEGRRMLTKQENILQLASLASSYS